MPGPRKLEGFLNMREAADALGMSYVNLSRACYKGRIRYMTTVGGRRRIPISEVERVKSLKGGENIKD